MDEPFLIALLGGRKSRMRAIMYGVPVDEVSPVGATLSATVSTIEPSVLTVTFRPWRRDVDVIW